MHRILVLLSFTGVLICSVARGQQVDSIWHVWHDPSRPDTTRLQAMEALIDHFSTDADTVYQLALLQEDLARKAHRKKERAAALVHQARALAHNGRIDEAITRYDSVQRMHARANDTSGVASAIASIGSLLYKAGDFNLAVEHYMRAMELRERMNDRTGVASIMNSLGLLHVDHGDAEGALSFYERCLVIHIAAGDSNRTGIVLNNQGTAFRSTGQYDRALANHLRSLAIFLRSGRKMGIAASYNNLAATYNFKMEPLKALDYSERSLKIRASIGDTAGVAYAQVQQAKAYLQLQNYDAALRCAENALRIGTKMVQIPIRKVASELLYEAHKGKGEWKEALTMYELNMRIRDSLDGDDAKRAILHREYAYEFGKKALADSLQHSAELTQVENARTIERLRADRNRNRAMGLGGGGILLVAGIGAYTVTDRKRRKAEFEQQAAQLETRALRAQMDPHFLYNTLNSISAYVQEKDVDSAVSYLARAARLMRLTLENSRAQEVSLEDDLEAVEAYLQLERDRANGRFDFTIQVDPSIDPEQTMVPPMVLQPFVENAIIHGFAQRAIQGSISIHAEAQHGKLLLRVEDNGVGRPATAAKSSSLGTAITRERLDLLSKMKRATAGFRYLDRELGTCVEIELPLSMT